MPNDRKNLTIVTHSGRFHADDCFAVATLLILLESTGATGTIVRSRNASVIEKGDFVVDVGGVYDETRNLFDHHQEGGAGKRENGIAYASFGLVWKRFAKEFTGSVDVVVLLDGKLVQGIDAIDNGLEFYEVDPEAPEPYLPDNLVSAFLPTWKEERDMDEAFSEAVGIAKRLLLREIIKAKDKLEAFVIVERAYSEAKDKRLIILDKNYPWQEVADKHPDILFVVKPGDGNWHALAVRKSLYKFENRLDFPKEWAGKRDQDLSVASGVSDAVFCHNNLFIAVARSKEGAVSLASKALQNS